MSSIFPSKSLKVIDRSDRILIEFDRYFKLIAIVVNFFKTVLNIVMFMFASFFHNVVSFVRSQEIRMARMAQLHGVGMPAIHGPGVRLAVATC